jgi:hypothetical protein
MTLTNTDTTPSPRPRRRRPKARPAPDVATAVVVHPRLGTSTARAMSSAGFARVADTGRCKVWVRYPAD